MTGRTAAIAALVCTLLLAACAGDDHAGMSVPELVDRLGRGGDDQRQATLELIRRGHGVAAELVAARDDAPEPVQRGIDSVLQEIGYFYMQRLIALFELLRDYNVDVTDAAMGFPEDTGRTAEELVAALLARLEETVEALDLRRRRDTLADGDREIAWLVELDRALESLRRAVQEIRAFLRQNPAASEAPLDLLERLTEAENAVRQHLERILGLVGEGDYDGDGTSNLDELERGLDPLRPGPF